MAISYGASGMPSYITSYIKPTPAAAPKNPWDIAASSYKPKTSTNVTSASGTQRYVPANASPAAAAKQNVINKSLATAAMPVEQRGVAIPSYGTNPESIAMAEKINEGVVSGNPVDFTTTTSTGEVQAAPSAPSGGSGGGSSAPAPTPTPEEAAASGMSEEEYQAMLDAEINKLLDPLFIGFQGDRAEELRRLQNYRNQLFGYTTEDGRQQIGSVQRQQDIDAQARRRLAAQRAAAGMLQGGAYAGTQRGVGTIQEAGQAYQLQELQRPFLEQVQADRLKEFGINYDPTQRGFSMTDWLQPEWATETYKGRQAAATARQTALDRLLARGISL